jgi:signal transduction histidine kinase
VNRYFNGVRGRVVLSVIAMTAALYSIIGVVGFLFIANSARDAIRERVNVVLDQLEKGLRAGSATVQISTPDGVEASVSATTGAVTPPATGEIRVVRTTTIEATTFHLVGVASEARLTASLRSLHRGLWIGVPLAVAVTGMMAGMATSRALRPVADITTLAHSIGVGDELQRVPVPETGDEIEHLARTVNEMLDRISAGLRGQRQFTSDAAHELRTPLMALQGEIEIALHHPQAADDEFLNRAAMLAGRLGNRVDDLVLLAALDESRQIDRGPVRLFELVEEEATGISKSIEVAGDRTAAVAVDRPLLARAIRNLLSNAQRHAANSVRATVASTDRRVVLHVDDDGPGIDPAQRDHVLQRFGRLDHARSTDAGGAGLGLAIVNSVVHAHGGDIDISTSPLGGARVTLTLPASAIPTSGRPD